jgi:cytochrome c
MIKSVGKVVSLSAVAVLASLASAQAEGNAEAGADVFRKCMACHRVGEGAKNLVGPVLNGVLGRKAGVAADFNYSDINKAAGAAGLEWNAALVFEYLEEPNTFLQKFLTAAGKPELADGKTKMAFKLVDKQDREDVIAYLKKYSPGK